MRHHRRPPMPPSQRAGACQWCAGAILYPAGHKRAGEPNLRRAWHPECVVAFFIATRSVNQRDVCWQRDQGRCRACGVVAVRRGWARGLDYYPWDARHGSGRATQVSWDELHEWDADHIRPLWSAPADMGLQDRDAWFGLENLQTLCRECHKAKTAREAAERSTARRPALPLFGRAA